jgi:acetyl esterase
MEPSGIGVTPMQLDSELTFHQTQQAAHAVPVIPILDVESCRARARSRKAYLDLHSRPTATDVTSRDDILQLGPESIRIRRYLPPSADRRAGMLVYVHGGGWVAGDLDTHDRVVRHLVSHTGLQATALDYALSPQARFPQALRQTCAAVVALRGSSPKGVLVLAGDSAGAHLAASATHRLASMVKAMLLFYPVVRPFFRTPSHRERGVAGPLTTDAMRWFWAQYLGHELPADGLQVSDAALDLTRQQWPGTPPAAVIYTAWHDPLASEGAHYARHLRQCGAKVVFREAEDMNHGFAPYLGVSDSTRAHVERAACDLITVLDSE